MMRLKASLRDVIGNRRGNVAVLFSVAIAPLLAVAVLAANYASISGQKSKAAKRRRHGGFAGGEGAAPRADRDEQ